MFREWLLRVCGRPLNGLGRVDGCARGLMFGALDLVVSRRLPVQVQAAGMVCRVRLPGTCLSCVNAAVV